MIDSVEYWQEREEAERQDQFEAYQERELDEFISNYGGEE